jgi:hypothetical protein
MFKKWFILLAVWAPCLYLPAQDLLLPDTIEQAKTLAYSGHFQEASELLEEYGRTNINIHSLQLHAQVLYWMQDYQGASRIYQRALLAFPDELILLLGYGRFLYELGELERSAALLGEYLQRDSLDAEANLLLASIDYYRGRIQPAKTRLHHLLSRYPDNPAAVNLLEEIQRNTAPYLQLNTSLATDDQPLQAYSLSLAGGAYRSRFFHPNLQFLTNQFSLEDAATSSWWLAAGNQFQFYRLGLSLVASGGIFQGYPPTGAIKATGQAALTQKILPYLKLELQAARKPYQHTLASVRTSFLHHHYRAGLALDIAQHWLGSAAYELNTFEDGNNVSTAYMWLLAPVLKRAPILLRAGYSYSYATSSQSNFLALQSLEEIIANYQPEQAIAGSYGLYFTPLRQTNHLLLIALQSEPIRGLLLAARSSISIRAEADNPYLFLSQKASGALYVAQESTPIRYTPFELELRAGLALSSQIQLNGSYLFSRLFFYSRHLASLQMTYTFPHEAKR